jgi:serine/threonine protein kinase
MQEPTIIGQGTYGCVHRPSLTCSKKPKISYHNKTSKLLSKKESNGELKEYKNVSAADPSDEFYLGKPVKCSPDILVPSNITAAKKCNMAFFPGFSLADYNLLIMEDGGENLYTYSDALNNLDPNPSITKKCELFLLESLRLFKGLVVFKQNGIVHHDLKPQNIVYNESKNRLNFIDFGIMMKKKDILELCAKDSRKYYFGSKVHWSFPWEIEMLDKRAWTRFSALSKAKRLTEFREKLDKIKKNTDHFGRHINLFLPYAFNNRRPDFANKSLKITAEDYREFYVNSKLDYADFAEKCVDTIDSYGLGFTMLYWLWNMRKHIQSSHPEMYSQLNALFYSMITPNMEARININSALFSLEKIIIDSGLLEKHGKKIVDNMAVISSSPVTVSEKPVIIKIKKSKKLVLENLEPGACVQGKERNPKTGRCINICKPGYIRNADFKCVKQKIVVQKPKSASSKKRKRCPNGTRRNNKTGNCE